MNHFRTAKVMLGAATTAYLASARQFEVAGHEIVIAAPDDESLKMVCMQLGRVLDLRIVIDRVAVVSRHVVITEPETDDGLALGEDDGLGL